MTRRDRLERKLRKREEWAEKAAARSEARLETASKMAEAIPFGQPILVGHHSEKRDRAYRERIAGNFEKAFELAKLAKHHEAKADGLARQLDGSIFSDDADAVEAIEARIAEREAEVAQRKRVNAAFMKAEGADKAAKLAALVKAGVLTDAEALDRARFFALCPWEEKPWPGYALTNLRANIRRDRERLAQIKAQRERAAVAASAPGGVAIEAAGDNGEYVRVTFAEKPDRGVLDALKAAGFWWAKGSWVGQRSRLPAEVSELAGRESAL